ncbi:MAG TPA: beta family protein [Terriglobia bacterium]|nr:beta family protein [Terriglobia bacterium]
MFDHRHYVPILRWKQAERQALRDLEDHIRAGLTPLVQLLPESIATGKRAPSIRRAFQKVAAEMRECWGTRPLLVDLRHIDPALRLETEHALLYLACQARANSVSLVPATGLRRDTAYQRAVGQVAAGDGRGICLRLLRNDLANPSLRSEVPRLLRQFSLEPQQVDVVLDIECHDSSYPDFDSLSSLIPEIRQWRGLAVASGAFPPDLTKWTAPGTYREPRRDWLAWRGEIELAEGVVRKPAFSDYGIYHPTYKPPPGFPNFSASIRYTSDDAWIVMRGEGVQNPGGAGFDQYPANAQLLCGMDEFRGPGFSAGDAYILARANHPSRTGNASTWLQAGFNHHMTLVVSQIASLFGT